MLEAEAARKKRKTQKNPSKKHFNLKREQFT